MASRRNRCKGETETGDREIDKVCIHSIKHRYWGKPEYITPGRKKRTERSGQVRMKAGRLGSS